MKQMKLWEKQAIVTDKATIKANLARLMRILEGKDGEALRDGIVLPACANTQATN